MISNDITEVERSPWSTDQRAITANRTAAKRGEPALSGEGVRLRAARSLLRLLDRRPPSKLVLYAPTSRLDHGVTLSDTLHARTEVRSHLADVDDLDVLDMIGLPPGTGSEHLDDAARQPYQLTVEVLNGIPAQAVVLSPMPVIDEIAPAAMTDSRVRVFEQSDRGVAVRMAVLEHVYRASSSRDRTSS